MKTRMISVYVAIILIIKKNTFSLHDKELNEHIYDIKWGKMWGWHRMKVKVDDWPRDISNNKNFEVTKPSQSITHSHTFSVTDYSNKESNRFSTSPQAKDTWSLRHHLQIVC